MTKHGPGRSSSQRGYVERTSDPADGRARLVRLTDAGRDLVRAALEAIDSIEGDWTTTWRAIGLTCDLRGPLKRTLRDLWALPPTLREWACGDAAFDGERVWQESADDAEHRDATRPRPPGFGRPSGGPDDLQNDRAGSAAHCAISATATQAAGRS